MYEDIMDEDQSYAFDTLELSDPLGLLQVRRVKTVILKESSTTNHIDSNLSDNLDDKQYLYKCTLCNEDFANKYFAKIHKDSKHSNIPDNELFIKHSVEKIKLENVEQLTRQETLKSELEKMQIRMLNVIRKEELVENRRQKLKEELLSKFLNQSVRHNIKSSDENSLKVKITLNDSVNNAENTKEFASKCKVKPFKMTRKQFVKKSKVKYSRKIFKCLFCSIHFMTELTLQEHLTKPEHLTENFEKSVRNCDMCELDFDLQSYPLHILTHHIQMGLKRADFLIATELKSTKPGIEEVIKIKTELPEENIKLNETITDQIRSFKQEPDEIIEQNVISHLEDIITKYIEESQKSSSNKTVELAESIPLTLRAEFINETTAKTFKKRDLSETLKQRLDLKQFDNRLYNCKNCSIHFLHYDSAKKHHKVSCNKNSTVRVKCTTCGLYFSDRSLRKHEYVHHDKMKLHHEDFSIVTVPEFNTSLSDYKEQGNKRFEYFIDDNVSKEDKQSSDKENFDIKRNRVEKHAVINKISEEFTSEKIDFRYDIFNGEITKCHIEIYTDSEDDFVKDAKEDSLNISHDNISKAKDLNNDFNRKINEKTNYPDKEYTSKEFMAKLNLIPLDKNLYKCGKCSLHFLSPEKLHLHLKKTCRNADVTKCLICRLNFDTNTVLHHKYLHHTKMKLKYKDFIVRTKPGLINDLKQTDKNKRREKRVNLYKCKECSLHFLSKENLEDYHQTRCKSNVRSLVKCLTCKLPFSAKCLRRHIYLHHKETQMLREDFNIITISNDVNRKRIKNSQYSKDFSEVIALNKGIKYLQIGDSTVKKTSSSGLS